MDYKLTHYHILLILLHFQVVIINKGFENLLAYISHKGVGYLGRQSLEMTVINLESNETVITSTLPLSSYAELGWFGFSEEGLLLFQDSFNNIRAFFGNNWINIYSSEAENKFWLVGANDYLLVGVLLGEDKLEPSCHPRPYLKTLKFEFPFYSVFQKEKCEEIYKTRMIITHEKLRNKLWGEKKFGDIEIIPPLSYQRIFYLKKI